MDGWMDTRTENERVILRERIFHCLTLLQGPNQPTCRKGCGERERASEVPWDPCDPPPDVRAAELANRMGLRASFVPCTVA